MVEPLTKRPKLDSENPLEIKIKSILPDDYDKEIPLEAVYTSKIVEKQKISSIIKELSQKLPLLRLQHLKRVRQNEIIICSVQDLAEEPLTEYLERLQLTPATVNLLCGGHVQKIEVPARATKLRWQFEKMQRHWPCKFHPDKYLESLYNGTNFSMEQENVHEKIANILLKLSHTLEREKPFGICVDPRTRSIVALAASRIDISPLMHCPMVLIDFVARTQNSGAWNAKFKKEFEFLEDYNETATKNEVTLAGIPRRYFDYMKNDCECRNMKFGAERLKANAVKLVEPLMTAAGEDDDNLSKYGPYLCTGYDVYLSQEPCLMCAMALVHSRVKRVFFVRRSDNGALVSRFKLHAVRELNHHYEVFQCHVERAEEHNEIIANTNGGVCNGR